MTIRSAAVIGSGVMGSGIAAQIANAGVPVLLLDIVPKASDGEDVQSRAFRNRLALSALESLKKSKPAQLASTARLDLIEVGNFSDDMPRLAECDWVVEAVLERLDIKQNLFASVEQHRRPDTIVSSNTSGLSVAGTPTRASRAWHGNGCRPARARPPALHSGSASLRVDDAFGRGRVQRRAGRQAYDQARRQLESNDHENLHVSVTRAEHALAKARRGHWEQTVAAFPSPAASP